MLLSTRVVTGEDKKQEEMRAVPPEQDNSLNKQKYSLSIYCVYDPLSAQPRTHHFLRVNRTDML